LLKNGLVMYGYANLYIYIYIYSYIRDTVRIYASGGRLVVRHQRH
jgi:hypothetical protein